MFLEEFNKRWPGSLGSFFPADTTVDLDFAGVFNVPQSAFLYCSDRSFWNSDYFMLVCIPDQVGCLVGTDFLHQIQSMPFDRFHADCQRLCNGWIGFPIDDVFENFEFSRCKLDCREQFFHSTPQSITTTTKSPRVSTFLKKHTNCISPTGFVETGDRPGWSHMIIRVNPGCSTGICSDVHPYTIIPHYYERTSAPLSPWTMALIGRNATVLVVIERLPESCQLFEPLLLILNFHRPVHFFDCLFADIHKPVARHVRVLLA